jgi:hypothetical protein
MKGCAVKTIQKIRIVHEDVPGGAVIALKDFNPELHEPFDDEQAALAGLEAVEDDDAGDEDAPVKPAAKKAAARKRGK